MAASDFTLIDNESDLLECVKKLKGEKLLYVDCEGVDLGRVGELCLLQIATNGGFTYLIEIHTLGNRAFASDLKAVLEDPAITKVFFDCREDCNALMHQFHVHVNGIEDVQILFLIYMKLFGKSHGYVVGLKKLIERNLPGNSASQTKASVANIMQTDRLIWRRRPLSAELLQYAANDVLCLAKLRNLFRSRVGGKIQSANLNSLLLYTSERYANTFRKNDKYFPDSPYFCTASVMESVVPARITSTEFSRFIDNGAQCGTCNQYTNLTYSGICGRCKKISVEKRF